MRRLRGAGKGPLAVAGILATPLFFAGLMAISLAVERPGVHHGVRKGRAVTTLVDPSGTTEAKIWLLAVLPPLVLLLVGMIAMLLGRAGVAAAALGAIGIAVALLVPLGTWSHRHTGRFPVGVDLIPPSAGSQDIFLRGEWEHAAKRTAEQLAGTTIALAGAALAIFVLLELRRRRRSVLPPTPPPPPELATRGAPPLTGM